MAKKEISEYLRQIIKDRMDEQGGKIAIADAKELIRPYCAFDAGKLIDAALTGKARRIIYALRDAEKVRYCFADDGGLYIDISALVEEGEMDKIEKQIKRKVYGLMKAWHKIRRHRKEIAGQISFDELDTFLIDATS